MKKYYYDLHIHSCLSPCGDNDSTPASIAGMGKINGLDIMALTDHNTCKNCPAFFEAAKSYGIIPIAGMELTTAEEIHLVCLFRTLEASQEFEKEVEKYMLLIPNRAEIFGEQLVCDCEDNIIGTEEFLLSNATALSLEEAVQLVDRFKGICYPAHIDRISNSIISILGMFPPTPHFSCVEIHDRQRIGEFLELTGFSEEKTVISSDAHYLWDIKEQLDYFFLEDDDATAVENLFECLR